MNDSLNNILNDDRFVNAANFEVPIISFIVSLIIAGLLSVLLGLMFYLFVSFSNVLANLM